MKKPWHDENGKLRDVFALALAQPAAGYSMDVIPNVDCAGLLVQLSQARDRFYK